MVRTTLTTSANRDSDSMGLQVRPEHHHADGRRNEQQPEMLAEGARHLTERRVHAPAQARRRAAGSGHNRAGNQRQQEMRDELAQALKSRICTRPEIMTDHPAGILSRALERSLKNHANNGTATAMPWASRKPGTSPCITLLMLLAAASRPGFGFRRGTQHALFSPLRFASSP